MDKYEYEIKTEQIRKLILLKEYDTAKKIADGMKWGKEKNPRLLSEVAELYVMSGEYDEAIDLLLQAYDYAHPGRMILKRLVDIAILAKNYRNAAEYCEEFHDLAPRDTEYYLMRYKVDEAAGNVSVERRIALLERYTASEMSEEWKLRLAQLYAEAGRVPDCVKLCDEIIFLFCNGEYVIEAMELKQQYAPLDKFQQEKYDHREEYLQKYREEQEALRLQQEEEERENVERQLEKERKRAEKLGIVDVAKQQETSTEAWKPQLPVADTEQEATAQEPSTEYAQEAEYAAQPDAEYEAQQVNAQAEAEEAARVAAAQAAYEAAEQRRKRLLEIALKEEEILTSNSPEAREHKLNTMMEDTQSSLASNISNIISGGNETEEKPKKDFDDTLSDFTRKEQVYVRYDEDILEQEANEAAAVVEETVETAQAAEEAFAEATEEVAETAQAAEEPFTEATEEVAETAQAAEEAFTEATEDVAETAQVAEEAFTEATEEVAETAQAAEEAFTEATEEVAETAQAAEEAFTEATEEVAETAQAAEEAFAEATEEATEEVAETAQAAEEAFSEEAQAALRSDRKKEKGDTGFLTAAQKQAILNMIHSHDAQPAESAYEQEASEQEEIPAGEPVAEEENAEPDTQSSDSLESFDEAYVKDAEELQEEPEVDIDKAQGEDILAEVSKNLSHNLELQEFEQEVGLIDIPGPEMPAPEQSYTSVFQGDMDEAAFEETYRTVMEQAALEEMIELKDQGQEIPMAAVATVEAAEVSDAAEEAGTTPEAVEEVDEVAETPVGQAVRSQLGDINVDEKKIKEPVADEVCFAITCDNEQKGLAYAIELLKRLPKESERPSKLARTTAEKLNENGLLVQEERLEDVLLVIEHAGSLSEELVNELLQFRKHYENAIVVIIDTDEGLRKLFARRPELGLIFVLRYEYEEKTADEWFEFMKEYAEALECVIAPGAEYLIKEYLQDRIDHDEIVFETLLKEIVDDAEHEADRFTVKNLFASAFGRKFNKDGWLILKARHF